MNSVSLTWKKKCLIKRLKQWFPSLAVPWNDPALVKKILMPGSHPRYSYLIDVGYNLGIKILS